MRLHKIGRITWETETREHDLKEDRFARTFLSKADMLPDGWNSCWAVLNESGGVAGAFVLTFSKRTPRVANLQLLHTFSEHRGKGVARSLMEEAVRLAIAGGARYFRVSAEPDAVEFYKKIGFKFWGKQKSGCQLCMFRIENRQPVYDINDAVINKAVYKKGKGGCVEVFEIDSIPKLDIFDFQV
jgi:GNAT superfamily N-acetyltransferase